MLGHLRFIELAKADADLVQQVELPGYRAKVDRVALIDVAAFDWNCPQHITQRFTLDKVEAAARPLRERIAALEEKLHAARAADPAR